MLKDSPAPSCTQNEYVWIAPPKPTNNNNNQGEFIVPMGARVKSIDGNRYLVIDDDGNEYYLNNATTAKVKVMHPTSVQGVEDMIGLGDLHEAGILRNLLIRYRDGFIYTYTGSILVAVNPYQVLPVYAPEHVKQYRQKKIGELAPHIFAIADNAYSNLFRIGNQCIIISGESGAGKTESTKIVLQFLAAISGQHSWIEQQILESNPILEAFGNAKTIRNDNSSRFGKYIDIQFNKIGSIEGARIEQYLLEKSRIVHQAQDERNYHVFYCMLAGMSEDEKRKLYLTKPNEYFYLTQGGGSLVCEGRQDSVEYLNILSAMKVLLFAQEEITQIFQLLAIILHLGNLHYRGKTIKNLDACEISNPSTLEPLSKLLLVNPAELIRALTTKTLITGGETVTSTLGAERSMDVRDAFCKGIYGKLFVRIVDKINNAIKAPNGGGSHPNNDTGISSNSSSSNYRNNSNGGINITAATTNNTSNLGVLDIFGFENFTFNSFEQFCINYANENLQQFFIRHIFKLEQEEYNLDGINWQHIDFVDNQETLDLIAGKPLHIVSLIDEESRFPKGTDFTLLDKLNHTHRKHASYVEPKSDTSKYFGINHFAGLVYYDVQGFIEKNRDTFSADLLSLIYSTENKFLHSLFHKERMLGPETRKKSPTLSLQFKKSLDSLMKALETCQPFFIRCIKPNDDKRPGVFDRELVVKQLRYSGMMETIRIRRNGYPIRHNFYDFFERYKHLVSIVELKKAGVCKNNPSPTTALVTNSPNKKKRDSKNGGRGEHHGGTYLITDYREAVRIICVSSLGPKSDFQIGHTKVFFKDCHDLYLEQARERALTRKIILIQKMVKGWIARRRFREIRGAARVIQTFWRGVLHRRRYLAMFRGFSRLEAVIKARRMHAEFLATRQFIVQLQSVCRGFLIRKETRKLIEEARKNRKKKAEQNYDKLAKSPPASKHFGNDKWKDLHKNNTGPSATTNGSRLNVSTTDEQAAIEELFGDLHLDVDDDEDDEERDILYRGNNGTKLDSDKMSQGIKSSNPPSAFKDLERIKPQRGLVDNNNLRNLSSGSKKGEYDKYFEELSLLDNVTRRGTPDDFDEHYAENNETEGEYKFAKFAATYFEGNVTHTFSRAELKQPLLPLKNPGDVLASLDVWIMILRFMGDMPEPDPAFCDSSKPPHHYFNGNNNNQMLGNKGSHVIHPGRDAAALATRYSKKLNNSSSSHFANNFHQPAQNTSVMNKIYTTLSRTAGKTIASDHSFVNYTRKNLVANYDTPNPYRDHQQRKQQLDYPPRGAPPSTGMAAGNTLRKKLISLTLKKKSKMPVELVMRAGQQYPSPAGMFTNEEVELGSAIGYEDPFDDGLLESLRDKPMSNLDKLHFIIGNGILRPRLRDEIYCQICKQLSNNPCPDTSRIKGWLLLSLCLGCFPPTRVFEKYLINFLHQYHRQTLSQNQSVRTHNQPGSKHLSIDFAARCLRRLKRTRKNGCRTQPPSWLELQAAKASIAAVYGTKTAPNDYNKDLSLIEKEPPIILPVTCMDGRTENLPADCATTSRELCLLLSFRLGLISKPTTLKSWGDTKTSYKIIDPENIGAAFGFSLYVALFDKVSSLGDGEDHVMDAVSQCEQYAKETGAQERNAPWRLFFRKEIFCPWREEHMFVKNLPAPIGLDGGLRTAMMMETTGHCVDLIYQQIIRGIKFGEYRCEKEEDLALITLQHHYIDLIDDKTTNPSSKNLPQIGAVPKLDPSGLISALSSYIPDYLLQREGDMEHWISLVMGLSQRIKLFEQAIPSHKIKEEIVNYAKYKWPLLFSRFYEASLIIATSPYHTLDGIINKGGGGSHYTSSNPNEGNYDHGYNPYHLDLNNNYLGHDDMLMTHQSGEGIMNSPILAQNLRKDEDIIIAVNWTGFYAVDDAERVLLELSFPEIVKVNYIPVEKANCVFQTSTFLPENTAKFSTNKRHNYGNPCGTSGDAALIGGNNNQYQQQQQVQPLLCVLTAREEVLVFRCTGAKDVSQLMNFFLDGLKKRSKYAVAVKDFLESDSSFLTFKKGEVIILDKPYGTLVKNDLMSSCSKEGGSTTAASNHNENDILRRDNNNNNTCVWLSGRSLSSSQSKGDVPSDLLYVIPTLSAPDPDVVKQLANNASLISPTNFKQQSNRRGGGNHNLSPPNGQFGHIVSRLFSRWCETDITNNTTGNSNINNGKDPFNNDHNLTPDTLYGLYDQDNNTNKGSMGSAGFPSGRYVYNNVTQPAGNNNVHSRNLTAPPPVHDLRQFSTEHFRTPDNKHTAGKRSLGQTITSTLSRKNPLKGFIGTTNNGSGPNCAPTTSFNAGADNYQDANEINGQQLSDFISTNNFKESQLLWKYDKEPLKAPLLKKLLSHEPLCFQACVISLGIVKYMGDQPLRRKLNYKNNATASTSMNNNGTFNNLSSPPLPTHSVDLTDSIFESAIKNEILRDEVYCQLIKQLTQNPNKMSEERGWELMWLATGCFPCSRQVLPELTEFLRTSYQLFLIDNPPNNSDYGISGSTHALKRDCLLRLQKCLKVGPRKYPPHPVEVEAIQRKTTQIFHKVYFPDDTEQAFEVDSGTKASEFCFHISRRLSLVSSQGFSLFVKISDKVISVPDQDFFFDFVRHLTDWIKKTCPGGPSTISTLNNSSGQPHLQHIHSAATLTYQIFFMRKLWLNVIPGIDRNADIIFHYHQEVPKFLRGYHKSSMEEAKVLAALIYRVKYGTDPTMLTSLSTFGKIVKDLVPAYLFRGPGGNVHTITASTLEDWRKNIAYYYSQTGDVGNVQSIRALQTGSGTSTIRSNKIPASSSISSDDAKIEFLKRVYQWPTFGSAFFEVKQTTEPSLPEYLIIAINKNGVTLIDPDSKDILIVFPFTQISNWSSGNTYFHITIGNLIQGSKLLCETSLGYKMDDLLTSYIGLMLTTMNKQRLPYRD